MVVVPSDLDKQISSGAQAKVPIYFNEVDPVRRDWLTYLTYIYTSEINKQTLAAAASEGQQNAGDIHSALSRMRNSLDTMEAQLKNNQLDQAAKQAQGSKASRANVQLAVF